MWAAPQLCPETTAISGQTVVEADVLGDAAEAYAQSAAPRVPVTAVRYEMHGFRMLNPLNPLRRSAATRAAVAQARLDAPLGARHRLAFRQLKLRLTA
jgi:hypothetical protein